MMRKQLMQANDINKFTAWIATIGELYGKSISKQLADIYWKSLKAYEFDDVQKAFQTHINNPDSGQFFPKPADVVRFIEGTGESKALEAWAKVEKSVVQVGVYRSIAFDDPLIHAVIEDMGGWVKLCSMKIDQMPFIAGEFQKRYMGYCIRKPDRYPKYLFGFCELENSKNGFEYDQPLLIGDAEMAREVVALGGGAPLQITYQNNIGCNLIQYLPDDVRSK